MKWYKHFSTMHTDTRIKRLLRKYGVKGYGLYNYILECIAFNLQAEKPIPDLEDDSHDIAQELKMDTYEVEEIVQYCVDQGLFQVSKKDNRIVCLKLLYHLDNHLSKNPEIRLIISNYKELEKNFEVTSKLVKAD